MGSATHPSARTHVPAASPSRHPVAGRACGSCSLCCKTVAIAELEKPNGVWCAHCVRGKGCAIYDARPAGCRDFYCEWMLVESLGPHWKPDKAKFALFVTAANHLTACVDPGYPSAWRQPPYYENLKRWARQYADDPASAWPGVDVWIGQRCVVILPDRDVDLGIVGAEEAIRVDCKATDRGQVYQAEKFTPQ